MPQSSDVIRLDDVLKTIIAEGASEGPEGMYGIASVIVNRANRKGKTLAQIVNEPHQFTGRFRRDLDQFVMRQPPAVHQTAYQALQRAITNPLPNVDHYLTTELLHSPQRPSWATKMKPAHVIGRHTFLSSSDE